MTDYELQFWTQVYVAFIRSGQGNMPCYKQAVIEADAAVAELRQRVSGVR